MPESTLTWIVWLPGTRVPVAKTTRRSWDFGVVRTTPVHEPPSTLTSARPRFGPVGTIQASPAPRRLVSANDPAIFDRRRLSPKAPVSVRVFQEPALS